MALRTATRQHWPASRMWGLGDGVTITARDVLLALALEYYNQSVCDGCGHSTLFTTHDDYDGFFAVQYGGTCLSCAANEKWRKANEKKDPIPGARYGASFTGAVQDGQIIPAK